MGALVRIREIRETTVELDDPIDGEAPRTIEDTRLQHVLDMFELLERALTGGRRAAKAAQVERVIAAKAVR